MEKNQTNPGRRKSVLPKSMDRNLKEYSNQTTIHGIKYLAGGKTSLAANIFWVIIFTASISCLVYCLVAITEKWLEHSVIISDNKMPTQIFELPFPSVTICPAIKLKRQKFDIENISKVLEELHDKMNFRETDFGKMYDIATQICSRSLYRYAFPFFINSSKGLLSNLNSERKINEDFIQTLKENSPNLKDVMKSCALSTWDRSELNFLTPSYLNCEMLFYPIITNEGICFTFNTIGDVLRDENLHNDFTYHDIKRQSIGWHPETGYTKNKPFPIKAMVHGDIVGSAEGLSFKLKANLSDRSNLCYPNSLGYKLNLNIPSSYPSTYETFIPIQYGKEYKISIKPKVITSSASLKSLKPETRQCYFNGEFPLKYYKFYSQNNCELECYANYSVKIIKGAAFSSPRDSNLSNFMMYYKDFGWRLPKYYYSMFMYNERYQIDNDTARFRSDTFCNCLPECNQIAYDYEINRIVSDLEMNNPNDSETVVNLEFEHPTFIGKTRNEMYTFVSLISDFGGLLGLFMGGSIVSLFELCYFLTIRNCALHHRAE